MVDGIGYIGCYTDQSGGRGSGILIVRRHRDTGALEPVGTAATPSPSFLVRHPRLPVLYAVNELAEGTVSAWRTGSDGGLEPIVTRSTGGDSPCHLAVTSDGAYLVSANYGSGSVCLHPLGPAGEPGERSDLRVHRGHGADPQRQEAAHAHMVCPDPTGDGLFAVDLGTDAVYRYRADNSRLAGGAVALRTPAGTGPRHLARHPDGRRCYLAGELDGSVTACTVSGPDTLVEVGRVPASRRPGAVQPSEIAVRADGRFLYLANRGVGTISVFALDRGDLPEYVGEVPSGGTWPRHFTLTGDGWLYVADERAHLVSGFRIDPDSGVPEPAGEPLITGSPTCVLLG